MLDGDIADERGTQSGCEVVPASSSELEAVCYEASSPDDQLGSCINGSISPSLSFSLASSAISLAAKKVMMLGLNQPASTVTVICCKSVKN